LIQLTRKYPWDIDWHCLLRYSDQWEFADELIRCSDTRESSLPLVCKLPEFSLHDAILHRLELALSLLDPLPELRCRSARRCSRWRRCS
jgi:hypothetical protein